MAKSWSFTKLEVSAESFETEVFTKNPFDCLVELNEPRTLDELIYLNKVEFKATREGADPHCYLFSVHQNTHNNEAFLTVWNPRTDKMVSDEPYLIDMVANTFIVESHFFDIKPESKSLLLFRSAKPHPQGMTTHQWSLDVMKFTAEGKLYLDSKRSSGIRHTLERGDFKPACFHIFSGISSSVESPIFLCVWGMKEFKILDYQNLDVILNSTKAAPPTHQCYVPNETCLFEFENDSLLCSKSVVLFNLLEDPDINIPQPEVPKLQYVQIPMKQSPATFKNELIPTQDFRSDMIENSKQAFKIHKIDNQHFLLCQMDAITCWQVVPNFQNDKAATDTLSFFTCSTLKGIKPETAYFHTPYNYACPTTTTAVVLFGTSTVLTCSYEISSGFKEKRVIEFFDRKCSIEFE